NVGGLGGKSGIGGNAPTPTPTQRDPLAAQYPPDLVFANIAERLGQQMPRPSAMPRGSRLIQVLQHPLFGARVVAPGLARARAIAQSLQALLGKALPPFRHASRPRLQRSPDFGPALALAFQEDDLSSFGHTLFGSSGPQ